MVIHSPVVEAVEASSTRNDAKMNVLESRVFDLLMRLGFDDILTQAKGLPGTPDFVLSKNKIAIFVNGNFWHSRRNESKMATHAVVTMNAGHLDKASFWLAKEENNRIRDLAAKRQLRALGFSVVVLWEDKLNREGALFYVGKTLGYSLKPKLIPKTITRR